MRFASFRADLPVLVGVLAWCASVAAQDAPVPPPEPAPPPGSSESAPAPDAGTVAGGEVTPLGHVEVVGEGPIPLVLVPFLATEWSIWKPFMERHRDDYTMYAVSLPGYSDSEAPPVPEDGDFDSVPWVRNAAKAIVEMVRERELDRPVLMGHGTGGSIAMRAGLVAPDLFRGIISVEGFAAMPLQGSGRARIDAATRSRFVSRFRGEGFSRQIWEGMSMQAAKQYVSDEERAREIGEHMGSAPLDVARRYFIESIADDFSSELAKLSAPLLVIVPVQPGSPVPPAMIREFWEEDVRAAPDHRIEFMTDSWKFPMDDRPEAFDAIVEAFIRGLDRAAAGEEPTPREKNGGGGDDADRAPERAGSPAGAGGTGARPDKDDG